MKIINQIICGFFVLLLISSCQKTESTPTETSKIENNQGSSDGLEQEPILMKNPQGEEATVVYFAQGDQVGIKITMNGEEKIYSARGTSDGGALVFSDGTSTWEMMDKMSGRFTDKDGKVHSYRADETK